ESTQTANAEDDDRGHEQGADYATGGPEGLAIGTRSGGSSLWLLWRFAAGILLATGRRVGPLRPGPGGGSGSLRRRKTFGRCVGLYIRPTPGRLMLAFLALRPCALLCIVVRVLPWVIAGHDAPPLPGRYVQLPVWLSVPAHPSGLVDGATPRR